MDKFYCFFARPEKWLLIDRIEEIIKEYIANNKYYGDDYEVKLDEIDPSVKEIIVRNPTDYFLDEIQVSVGAKMSECNPYQG